MAEPWERLENEPIKAYRYFELYRSLGLGRTLQTVAEISRDATTELPPRSIQVLKNYSSRYDWQERIKAWEYYQAQLRLEIDLDETGNDHRKHISDFRQTFFALGKKEIALAVSMLNQAEKVLLTDRFQKPMKITTMCENLFCSCFN